MMRIVDLCIGGTLSEVQLDPVSRTDLLKYAEASGDPNPIHFIDEEAKKAGLPGIIAQGMWVMGNLAKLFSPFYAQGFIQDYSVRFKNMVFLDDVITLKAELKEKIDNQFHFEVQAFNQHGKQVIAGQLSFQVQE